MTIRTIVVDEEPLGRENLVALLAGTPDVTLVGECADGLSAVEAVRLRAPHLLFLDVHMPGGDALRVMESLGPGPMPLVVLMAAHDNDALRAFEARAVDCLLKPFGELRLGRMLERVRSGLAREEAGRAAAPGLQPPHPCRFAVRSSGRISFVRTAEIDWVEAAGNYVQLHVGHGAHTIRTTMACMERQLDPFLFARIHRSHIVNLDRVREMRLQANGEHEVVLRTGIRLSLGRGYRDAFRSRFGGEI